MKQGKWIFWGRAKSRLIIWSIIFVTLVLFKFFTPFALAKTSQDVSSNDRIKKELAKLRTESRLEGINSKLLVSRKQGPNAITSSNVVPNISALTAQSAIQTNSSVAAAAQAIDQTSSANQDEANLPRLTLLSLKEAGVIASKNLSKSNGPKTQSEAQSLGWKVVDTVRGPEPVDSLVAAKANELDQYAWKGGEKTKSQTVSALDEGDPVTSIVSVRPNYISFFAKPGKNPGLQTIKIANGGTGTLSYSLSEAMSWASLSAASGSVSEGVENQIDITISTAGLSASQTPYQGQVVIQNTQNANDRQLVTLRLYVTNDEGLVTTSSYDASGNLALRVDPDGNKTEYEYDKANRLIKIIYPNGDTVAYEYDKNGNKSKITDKTGTTYLVYKSAAADNIFNQDIICGPMDKLCVAYFPGGILVQYFYDNNGNLAAIRYPDNFWLYYVYDGNKRLKEVSYTQNSTTFKTTYTYNPQTGNLETKTLANGVKTTYQYDTADRLTDVINKQSNGTLISSYHYDLDPNGNRKQVTETTSQGTQITKYDYDELNRLKQTTYPDNKVVSYTYDDLGNRLTKTENGVISTYKYDLDNRLISITSPSSQELFFYDKRGNLVKRIAPDKTMIYEFDYENRLTKYKDNLHTVTYEYNTDGIRLSKTVDGVKTNFINDIHTPLTQVLMEASGNWGIRVRYIYGKDEILSQERF